MRYLGKIIGALLGFALTRHPIGLAAGLVLGHAWDMGWFDYWLPAPGAREGALLSPLFVLAGMIAKADGYVSEQDVAIVRQLIARLDLKERTERVAIDSFNRGKRGEADFARTAEQLNKFCGYNGELKLMLVDVLADIACAHGPPHPQARALVGRVAQALGLDAGLVEELLRRPRGGAPDTGAEDPYAVLMVRPDASDEEVRTAYRRLMAKYHPDKWASQEGDASMQAEAQRRARAINAAFERIKLLRDLR